MAIKLPKANRKNIELKYSKEKDEYFLDVEYEIETDDNIQNVKLKNVSIDAIFPRYSLYRIVSDLDHNADLCNVKYELYSVLHLNVEEVITTDIKTKTKEMTIEEIEKKLGHKIKIVGKED